MTDLNMEKLEIVIAVLVLCLVALAVYAVTSWTLTRKKRRSADADREKDAVPYKYLEEEAEHVRKKVATAYAQETMPRITITPVQPRPDFSKSLVSSDETGTTDEEEEESQSDDHPDLGRLYFALRYDQHRSMLMVRLIRAEDIPMENQSTSTYVDVHLLPLNLQSRTVEPFDTTINVSFREVYEFPLSQSDMALQTLNLHICRYDNYSRGTSVGDVFLALAELSAQGIDFTREVFLCRNIISHQEIYRTLGRRKRLHPAEEEEQQRETKPGEKRAAKKVSSQKMWDVLRRAVRSGSYKGADPPSDAAMYWESIFSPRAPSPEGYNFSSPKSSPVKSSEFHFSGSGPPGECCEEPEEEQGASWKGRQETTASYPTIPTDESEIESSANEQEGNERRSDRSHSFAVEPVQLSPAPEEYYRIVPITPFTLRQENKERTEPSFSWKLPQTFTSHDRDVVQTLSQAYKEPRVVSFGSRPRGATGDGEEPPPAKQHLFEPTMDTGGKETRRHRQAKTSRQKRPERRSRKVVSIKHSRKMSPRKEPDGEPAEHMASGSTRGKVRHSAAKFRVKSSPRAHKMVSRRRDSGPAEGLSMDPAELSEDDHATLRFPSISAAEHLTPPMSALKDFYSINRSQSDPTVDVEYFRSFGEPSSESRRTRSMLEFREEWTDEEES